MNLRHQNRPYLSEAEKQRVDRVIEDTKHAVPRIAKNVEPARRDVAKRGTVNVVDRFDWVLRRSAAVELYQHSLDACQRSLQGQIVMLRMAALAIPTHMPPPYGELSWSDRDAHPATENLLEEEGTQKTPVDGEADSSSDGDGMSCHDRGATSNADAFLVQVEHSRMSLTRSGDPSDIVEHRNKFSTTGTPTPTVLHSERILYEEMQRLHKSRRRRAGGRLHPKRELYEQMQLFSKCNYLASGRIDWLKGHGTFPLSKIQVRVFKERPEPGLRPYCFPSHNHPPRILAYTVPLDFAIAGRNCPQF